MNKTEAVEYNLPNASITYLKKFYTDKEAKKLFEQLMEETEWKQDRIKMFGKILQLPRLQAFYGDIRYDYSYSNIKLTTKPWTPTLLKIKNKLEHFCEFSFTSVLLNLYRNGKDSNGWHADDEPALGTNPYIASLSFGATRSFHIRHIKEKSLKQKIDLEDGSLLIMKNETQHFYQHQLAKTAKVVGNRINLTFRKLQ